MVVVEIEGEADVKVDVDMGLMYDKLIFLSPKFM